MDTYNIGYMDGRNHTLSLTAKLIESLMRCQKSEKIVETLSNREALESALQNFDSGFFNNYDEEIGQIN